MGEMGRGGFVHIKRYIRHAYPSWGVERTLGARHVARLSGIVLRDLGVEYRIIRRVGVHVLVHVTFLRT
jgi:hypothetical protein